MSGDIGELCPRTRHHRLRPASRSPAPVNENSAGILFLPWGRLERHPPHHVCLAALGCRRGLLSANPGMMRGTTDTAIRFGTVPDLTADTVTACSLTPPTARYAQLASLTIASPLAGWRLGSGGSSPWHQFPSQLLRLSRSPCRSRPSSWLEASSVRYQGRSASWSRFSVRRSGRL